MDIVIPFQHSPNADLELLYTLRSFSGFVCGAEHAYIVGDTPRWSINPSNVTVIPFGNVYPEEKWRKRNVVNKLIRACREERISKMGFIAASDRQFLLAPCDAEIIPNYHKGRSWRAGSVVEDNTRKLLQAQGKKIDNFYTHSPFIIIPALFQRYVTEGVDWSIDGGYCIKAIYADRMGTQGEFYHKELCINATLSFDEVDNIITAGHRYFTAGRTAFQYGVKSWLEQKFPDKSKYEL